jgi:tetrahydromethanopterin S-methyltransferase subunit G
VSIMAPDNDLPETFREVGIFLRGLKGDIEEVKSEVDDIKKAVSRLMGIIFTAIIGPIIVAIIVASVLKK